MNETSRWHSTDPVRQYSALSCDIDVDVLVVGAGITGTTCAYLLMREGLKVALVDMHQIGSGQTGQTTAHITYVSDTRLPQLVSKLGEDRAAGLWKAGEVAMSQIADIVSEEQIDCDLRQIPGHLVPSEDVDSAEACRMLSEDVEVANRLGFDARLITSDGILKRPAAVFPNQMKFHPLAYVGGLAKAVEAGGGYIFGDTLASEIDPKSHTLKAHNGVIRYQWLVTATHVPVQGERGTLGAAAFQTRLSPYSTYVLEATVEDVPESLYWDTNDPYLYLRFDRTATGTNVIIGGEDHKTGQADRTEEHYARLEQTLHKLFPGASVHRRWSGQVWETFDGLPYIGQCEERQFLATGFAGTGMTLGTYSAMLIRDLILDRPNPMKELFDPGRKSGVTRMEYVSENKDFPLHLVKDRFVRRGKAEDLSPGTGAIVRVDGKLSALYCRRSGERVVLDAVCPHMGCVVVWNDAEETWDCPCHGSRFQADGELLNGPAEEGLRRL